MKISKIETIPFKLQQKEPFVLATVSNFDMFYVLVRIETDEGVVGYGEATPAWEVTGETWESVVACVRLLSARELIPFSLLGQEIGTLEQVEQLVEAINPLRGLPLVAANPSAKAAVEQALFDAYGKFVGKPIYALYGGRNRPIPFAGTIGVHTVDETLGRVRNVIERASLDATVRLKIGVKGSGGLNGYERDVRVIRQAREMIRLSGKAIRLVADANQGFVDPVTAIDFCQQIDGCLDWLEQPILARDLLGFGEIKRHTAVPLMADESVHSYEDAELLLALGGIDYLNIKLMKTGGLLPALRIIDCAAAYGVRCQIGSMLESALGVSMGCHAFLLRPAVINTGLSAFRMLKVNVGTGLTTRDDLIQLSSDPGTGILVDEGLVARYRVT